MKKLCLAALAAVSLLGCSDTKEEEKTAEKATEKAAEPVRGVTDTATRTVEHEQVEDPQLDADHDELYIDMPVEVDFVDVPPEFVLPIFKKRTS